MASPRSQGFSLEADLVFKTNLESAIKQYGSINDIPEAVLLQIVNDWQGTSDILFDEICARYGGPDMFGAGEYTARTMLQTGTTTATNIRDLMLFLNGMCSWVVTGGGSFGPESWQANAREYEATSRALVTLSVEIAKDPVTFGTNVAAEVERQYTLHNELLAKGDYAGAAQIAGTLYGNILSVVIPGEAAFAKLTQAAPEAVKVITAGRGTYVITAENFFEGAYWSPKVRRQLGLPKGDYHTFPSAVEGFAGEGRLTTTMGGDGKIYWKLEIPGSYGGKDGMFEFIRDSTGKINHRFFNTSEK